MRDQIPMKMHISNRDGHFTNFLNNHIFYTLPKVPKNNEQDATCNSDYCFRFLQVLSTACVTRRKCDFWRNSCRNVELIIPNVTKFYPSSSCGYEAGQLQNNLLAPLYLLKGGVHLFFLISRGWFEMQFSRRCLKGKKYRETTILCLDCIFHDFS